MGVEDYNKKQLERLKEHKIAFDQEAMWAAMQKKKKRRGAFFFFTMALVALAIVFFIWCLFCYSNSPNALNSKENTSLENEKTIPIKGNKTEILNLDKADVSKNSEIYHENNNGINDADIKSKSSNEIKTSIDVLSKNTNTELLNKRSSKYRAQKFISTKSKQAPSINNQNDERITSNLESQNNNDKNNPDLDMKSNDLMSKNLDNINIHPLKLYEFPYLESLKDLTLEFDDLNFSTVVIADVIKPKKRLHIGTYAGVGYLFRQTTLENLELELPNETLEELSIGFDLKYQLTPNIFVRSGIEYWHATERKETSSTSVSNVSDLPNTIVGMEEGIIINTTYSKIHTIYQSYNIPAIVGWNTNNAKWNIFAEAGLLYNFQVKRKRDESLAPVESDKYNIGSTNQISPIVGVGLSFCPSRQIELFTRAGWRGSQNVTVQETPASLKFGSIRSQIGMRIGI